jgi:DNA-binding NtrC family response regulator
MPADTRIVSASNKDILALVRENHFREDLYFRLVGVTLSLPPLRERTGDIPLLVGHFWSALEQKYKRSGPELSRDALTQLAGFSWPGNVRQLRSVLERLFALVRSNTVRPEDVVTLLETDTPQKREPEEAEFWTQNYRDAKRLWERDYLARKLRDCGGNVTRTAAAIGLERQTLQEKIKTLGVLRP